MTRHWLAIFTAAALGTAAAPALAQAGPPPPVASHPGMAPPAWVGPQAPGQPVVVGPASVGAPFAPQPGYPGMPSPYPGGAHAQGGWVWHGEGGAAAGDHHAGGPYAAGNWVWEGEGTAAAGYGYASGGYAGGYQYGPGAAPCGCPGYGYPVTWVQVPVQTRYSYSPAIRHDQQIVEEHVVNDVVVETKTVRARPAKYVKTTPTKMTKSKVVRTTK